MTSPDVLTVFLSASYRIFDLGRPLSVGMPQSPSHPEFRHTLVRRHGDAVRLDGDSAANDLIMMGTHVGTHIDAVAHISHAGSLFANADAAEAQVGGTFETHGIHTFTPYVGRGVLLDVPTALHLDACTPSYEITPADLEATLRAQGTSIRPGEVVLVRTGWAQRWDDRDAYEGKASGVPGIGESGASWLAHMGPIAVGADTIAFDSIPPGAGHARLPAHRVLLFEHGINIIETLDLEELSAAEAYHFLLVLNPLNVVGATGAPVRPLAVTFD